MYVSEKNTKQLTVILLRTLFPLLDAFAFLVVSSSLLLVVAITSETQDRALLAESLGLPLLLSLFHHCVLLWPLFVVLVASATHHIDVLLSVISQNMAPTSDSFLLAIHTESSRFIFRLLFPGETILDICTLLGIFHHALAYYICLHQSSPKSSLLETKFLLLDPK